MNSESIIQVATSVARRESLAVFLVGGPVRDLRLGVPVADVDFALETDAERFAQVLCAELHGDLHAFPQFLTWKVVMADGTEVDVATTRRESYAHPGALPEVERASLQEDLRRRDFAANALAMDLDDGHVVDPLGGLDDLRDRRFRILHDRSFIDDPTRILRGLRLCVRLGFTFDYHTARLCEKAIATEVFSYVSRERLWRELFLVLREPSPAAALSRMAGAGALQAWLGPVDISSLSELERLTAGTTVSAADRKIVYAAALLAGRGDIFAALPGSGFSNRENELLVKLTGGAEDLCTALGATDFYDPCRMSSEAALLFLASRGERCAEAVARCRAYKEVTLGFSGAELEVEPGPHIGRAMEETRRALFNGSITSGEAEGFARSLALQYLSE
ncbi:MAG: hypothetical protein ABI718_04120 [Acidobacteriota bacterium]